MKHYIQDEVFGIYGKNGNFSRDYLIANKVEMATREERKPEGKAYRKMYIGGPDSLFIMTASGKVEKYKFGEKVFFDTMEELEQARAERKAMYAESARRKKAMEKINALTTEELEKLVANL